MLIAAMTPCPTGEHKTHHYVGMPASRRMLSTHTMAGLGRAYQEGGWIASFKAWATPEG